MRCIFCKLPSDGSRSVEHIIPESLGNVEHVLPPGIVCDACNNYFAREVERPFLDSAYIKEARFRATIPSKKGVIPAISGIHLQSITAVQMFHSEDGSGLAVSPMNERDNARWSKNILMAKKGTLVFPVTQPSDDRVTSRFIAKVGLEVLAQRTHTVPGGLDEITDKPELDELRRYARRGDNIKKWPISVRSIYPPDFLFPNGAHQPFEVSHEYMILADEGEYFVVVAIFGIEYSLNLGGPEIDGYEKWLLKNGGKSPLYRL